MSTTIDNLQIEIESRSANATSNIDRLANSLGKLKENGGFKTAVNNLERLSRALDNVPNTHKQSTAIRTLAGALERLKKVGSIAKLNGSLEQLPHAISALDNVKIDKQKFDDLANAMSSLSAVKHSGFSSMVNAMDKLDKVTKKLGADDGKLIADFAEKVKELNDVVAPLAINMGNIADGFKGINAILRPTNILIDQANTKVNVGVFNLSNLSNVLSRGVWLIKRGADALADLIEEAIEWDGIADRFGRGFGAQAQETYDYILKLNNAMNINVQQFMQYSSTYATMLKGYGVAQEDAAKMARGYMELTYDVWAGSNDFYKTLEDAAIAIRSAISGESESIKKMGFSVTDAMLEQTIATHGLEISLNSATEAQKSYLRYLSLVDQAHAQNLVGTYAEELNTAEGMMRTLNQQIKSLSQSVGSLFLPILTKTLPYVQAFVELLEDGVHSLARMLGVELQKVDFSGYTDGADSIGNLGALLEGATESAKELKNATIGIDELNVISPGSDVSAGSEEDSSSPFGDIESLWDQTIFDKIQTDVGSIKGKLEGWMPVIEGVSLALAGLHITKLLESLDTAELKMSTLGKGITLTGISVAVGKLVWDFTGTYLESGNEADLMKAIGTTVLGTALAGFLVGKPGAALTLLTSGVVTLTKLAIEIDKGAVEFDDPQTLITGLLGGIETAIGALFTWKTLGPVIKGAWPKLTALGAKLGPWGWVATAVVGGIVLAFVDKDFTPIGEEVGKKVGEVLGDIGSWIDDAITKGLDWAKEALDIDDMWDVLSILFKPGELMKRITPELKELFDDVSEKVGEKVENLKGNINEFFDGFFDGLFEGLGLDVSWATEFAEIFDIEYLDIVDLVVNPSSLGKHIIDGIKSAAESGKLPQWFEDNVATPLSDVFSEVCGKIAGFFSNLGPNIKSLLIGAMNTVITRIEDGTNSLIRSINKVLSGFNSVVQFAAGILGTDWSGVSLLKEVDFKLIGETGAGGASGNFNSSLLSGSNVSKFNQFSFAANGGMFEQGSLVFAGERGAEILTNAPGGKTGVMNIEQMQQAVYEGVYAAVSAAMSGKRASTAQAVNVYLDGRQITNAVEQRQRERGASIMGREVYSY